MNTARMRHIEIMRNFLTELNKETDTFILKGGTSLLLAYGLDRFSEALDKRTSSWANERSLPPPCTSQCRHQEDCRHTQ